MPELAQSLAGQREQWDELDPGLRAMLQYAESIARDDYIAARRGRYAACEVIDRLLGEPLGDVAGGGTRTPRPGRTDLLLDLAAIRQPVLRVPRVHHGHEVVAG